VNAAEAIAFVGLAFLLTKVFGPIGAAIGARIRGPRDSAPDHQLASEVDQLKTRLAEVEERLDFAERLLTRGAEADQIPGGVQR
jgi:hypothetical protein